MGKADIGSTHGRVVGNVLWTYSIQTLLVSLSCQAMSRENENDGLPSAMNDRKTFRIQSEDQMGTR